MGTKCSAYGACGGSQAGAAYGSGAAILALFHNAACQAAFDPVNRL